ncbi:MAG: transcription antitermination factor NusB [Clostridiales bacterium]|nr:transcription antitermination factor NusB [Clostridiales bacterium]
MRRDSREAVYKILFAELFNDNCDTDFENFIYEDMKLNEEDKSFATTLLCKIRENREDINSIIADYAKGYKPERIYPTDKCALSLAICELKYFDDIPNVVAIDEALTLVRKFSTEESLKFVNGILAAYKKDLEG